MGAFLHLTERAMWEAGLRAGEYVRADLAEDGFIHCLTADTLVRVAEKFYRDRPDLVLLVIQEEKVKSPVLWEPASDGKLYPHIYGPLNPDAVVQVLPYGPEPDGSYTVPTALPREEGAPGQ
jgi:uncharacterized protein (DUF952 family)